jgi:hypothetical protein
MGRAIVRVSRAILPYSGKVRVADNTPEIVPGTNGSSKLTILQA